VYPKKRYRILVGVSHFVVSVVYTGGIEILVSVNVDYVFALELLGKCRREEEGVESVVVVVIEYGFVFENIEAAANRAVYAVIFFTGVNTGCGNYIGFAFAASTGLFAFAGCYAGSCGNNGVGPCVLVISILCTTFGALAVSAKVVSDHFYYLLSYEGFATLGALLTFGKAGCSTSRSYCLENCFGVRNLFYYLLSYEGFATLGALLTFGKTGCGTSRCYRRNYFLGMFVSGGGGFRSGYFLFGSGIFGSLRGSFFLSYENVTRSNREHHSNGKNQCQNAQNVLVLHLENLHKKFGAGLHGNIIS